MIRLRNPESIAFRRPNGETIRVPPITRGQVRAVIALETDEQDIPSMALERRSRQLAVMCADATCTSSSGESLPVEEVFESLTAEEEIDIVNGLIAQHTGIDPRLAVDLQQALRDVHEKKKKPANPRQ